MADYGIHDGTSLIGKFTAPLTVKSNHPVFMSDTLSLGRQISRRSAQRWEIETGVEPLKETANELFVHLVTKGFHSAVSILMPQNYAVSLKRTSTTSNTATGTLNASSVTIAVNTGLIPKGTFIKFANHNKIYMVTTDITGTGTMSIYPNLISAVPASTAFTYRDDVFGTFLFDTDVIQGMVYSDGVLMNIGTIRLVEKLV